MVIQAPNRGHLGDEHIIHQAACSAALPGGFSFRWTLPLSGQCTCLEQIERRKPDCVRFRARLPHDSSGMTDSQWTVGPGDASARLDKFLASPDRLGSRARAAAALARGKVFL